ncbi:ABC transporter ATP-binding protein [Paenibacillus sp. NAIST15-1]|uniref:ABC transporter ATP-binding protein n=1 Tax=Paenibacillus sp. NAIST15-1 TaxID=1605994 RepID=UPI00086DA0F1|nr:ABC transporter ATP-binding protein [Paenibacillus sp. NAIST15-1]GAV11779.1 ABC transporter ATP-binding protein/permease [Paenibacillus sp. NAIST15-1]
MATTPLPFMLRLVQKQRVKLIASCICSAAGAVFALVPYVLVFRITDLLLRSTVEWHDIRWLILMAFISILLRFILMGASTMLAHAAAFHVLYDLRACLIDKLGKLPLGFFSEQHSGRVKKIVADDVERIESFIAHHLPDLTASLVAPLLTIAYLFSVDWRLAIAALLPIPAAYAVQGIIFLRGRRSEDMKQMHHLSETMNGAIVEFVHAMPVIKSFNQTVHSFARYRNSVESYAALWGEIARKKTPLYTLFLLLLESGLLYIMPLGAWLYGQGSVTFPVLVLFLLLGVGLTAPLRQISTLAHMMQNNMEGVRRIQQLLAEEELSSSMTVCTGNMPTTRFDISFQNVTFAYENRQVLHDIHFTAEHGKVTALVGPSGAGKSTAAQLIARFYEVSSGAIQVGGIDIRSIPPEQLMDMVSFVFQDVPIVSDTVAANLRMGKGEAQDDELISAAKAAQAHEFIMAMPNGYNTLIGEGGVHISGGERQRIAIARAILKDAPILILDEAFAFADAENEAKIQDALSRLMHQRTVIVIAHRLSSITDADCIVVLEDGHISGIGTHDELLAHNPLYAGMWIAHREADDWSLEGKDGAYV